MMYVSNKLREQMGERRTSADIVFELLSESTGVYDHTTKADTYLALGVKELWLIDANKEEIEIRNADSEDEFLFWQRKIYKKAKLQNRKFLPIGKLPSAKSLENNYLVEGNFILIFDLIAKLSN